MSVFNLEKFQQSFNCISFYGERRGKEEFDYYTDLLTQDLNELGENQGNYKEKFISKVNDIVHKRSSCASAFIVGPANFPINRNRKRWDSYDNSVVHFDRWREKYFKAVNRVRTPSPEEDIDEAVKRIDKLLVYQIKAKQTNKLLRKYKINNDIQFGFEKNDNEKKFMEEMKDLFEGDEPLVESVIKENCFGQRGYASFELTSINEKIKRSKDKIKKAKNRIGQREWRHEFDGGSMYIANDRVIISHDEKPEKEIIKQIKESGFRWSPKFGNWCRKHTANGRYSAERLLKKWNQ